MKADAEDWTKNLGLITCFMLIAFIFYSLGSRHPNLTWQRLLNLTELESPEIQHAPPKTWSDYDRGFKDGSKTFLTLKVHDMNKAARSEARDILDEEKQLKKKLKELEEGEKTRQRLFDEKMTEMKNWREEQLRSIWSEKQAKEKGFISWFRGSGVPRKSKVIVPKSPVGQNAEGDEQFGELGEKKGWV